MRKLLAAAGALCLAVGLIGTGAGTAAAKEPDRLIAVCEHRLCLLVLDTSADQDGDGIADVDEEKLGTDPKDRESRPEAHKIFDVALARELPSFEEHLTELVSLPQVTPDGEGLATAFGKLPFSAELGALPSVERLMSTLRTNGFTNLGTNLSTVLSGKPSLTDAQRLTFAAAGGVAVYGDKTDEGFDLKGLVGATSFGANAGRTPTGMTDAGFSYGPDGSFGHDYSVGYADGGRDEVSSSASYSDDVTVTTNSVTSYQGSRETGHTKFTTETTFTAESGGFSNTQRNGTVENTRYDDNGNATGGSRTEWFQSEATYADGSSSSYTRITVTNYDENGNVTETQVIVEKEETSADGEKRTETSCQGNGCDTPDDPGDNPDDPGDEPEEPGDESEAGCMPYPDYVGVGVPTEADMNRALIRLNSNRTPNRNDDGQFDPTGFEPPKQGGYNPLIALVNPDGVASFAVSGKPRFNGAQPEYGPQLGELGRIAGGTAPYGPWS